jgi:ABC-type dipeptide/oligopeptide/nickel transport system ATPase component
MKIQSLQYEDLSTGWKLDLIEFNPQLTLLVGASGVGKTQILKALLKLRNISQGANFTGIKWNVKFQDENEVFYEWCGEFEAQVISGARFSFDNPRIKKWSNPSAYYEKLYINHEEILNRNDDGIFFNKEKTVQLPKDESIVFLLKEEEKIKAVIKSFEAIFFEYFSEDKNNEISYRLSLKNDLIAIVNEYNTIEKIRNSNLSIKHKLFLCYKNNLYHEIESNFLSIFPSIEKIMVDAIESMFGGGYHILLGIKEKRCEYWIYENDVSSGMLKTLTQIAKLYLCPDNSVILIDEFENSLGINCIDEVVYQMLASERDLQFIITSHHPYIINKIGYEYWKVVTRKGSVVKAVDAEKLGIGKSRLQAFTQLGNLPAFANGIES